MLIKDAYSMESYIHRCDNRRMLPDDITIYLHDVHAHFIGADKKLHEIKYCPYCGVEIDREARP